MIAFTLPKTRNCSVVWYRNGERHETVIPTPSNMEGLKNRMIQHKVGYSEIRTVKAVQPREFEPVNVETINVAHLGYLMSAI